nr:redox-sensitive transcriptional activator SoxR [Terrabacter sp. MAHUQ-38]
MTIGQVAERTGAATSALRYWEDLGLISSVRTTGNQRRYERATIRRVSFIRAAQRVGLSLDEIGAALATLPDGRTPTANDWARLSRAWRSRLDEQIRRIEKLRDQLDSCIGCGCLSLRTCALNNPSDVLADHGPGAVLLEP